MVGVEAILLPGPDKSQVDELIQPKEKLLFSGSIGLVKALEFTEIHYNWVTRAGEEVYPMLERLQ